MKYDEFIHITGAKEHNLKSVNVDIPKNQLVVITGPSGSGKSSLAFDTIYAEGQRRYVESLSAYARQFLNIKDKPDVESIMGLSPAIAIDQKTTSHNPRSTVGTVTEIYDYLRLLYARIGVPHSPTTGLPIESQTISQMVDKIMELKEGTKLLLLAPIVRGHKGEHRKLLMDMQRMGYERVMLNGEQHLIGELPKIDKNKKHDIEVVVDRIVIKPELETRLADSIEAAMGITDGLIFADIVKGKRLVFSSKYACPVSGFCLPEIEPRLFSFNSPYGACPECDGLGDESFFDPDLIVPDTKLSLTQKAIAPWANSTSKYYIQTLHGLADHYGFSLEEPFSKLSDEVKEVLLYGSDGDSIRIHYNEGSRTYSANKPFEGIIPNMKRRFLETDSNWMREELGKYQNKADCETCGGARLKQEALCVKLDGKHVGEITALPIDAALNWFEKLPKTLTKKQKQIGAKILGEIGDRLGFLSNVGLEYLTLSREAGTLSGGEAQRIRLASQIGSGLTGVLYVLDEPSIGLHQRDNQRLIETLRHLRDLGNTVIVVEHDEETMLAADHLIDIGPGAGIHGGHIISEGTPKQVSADPKSITGQYLSGKKSIPIPKERRTISARRNISITGASGNNLQNVDVDIPLGTFCCVTGVSGGGKSTLVIETLCRAISQKLNNNRNIPAPYESMSGLAHIDKIIQIDQSPIGRTPRSNPATYTGAFTPIRDWYAALPEAKARGYQAGRFSFNVKGGRCEACQGDGLIKIEMHFLPDVYVKCDVCQGKRYSRETLEIRYKDKSIADVLQMTVDEGVDFFKAQPNIREKLLALQEVGLGYIAVGQSATTLSGGEAQRIKLAKELSKRATGRTFYVLDEPTTGLHANDIQKLLHVLHRLVDNGNTVLVIEHNLDVVKTSDWVIDIGPGGGNKGGEIIATGTPEDVAKNKRSVTGEYLKTMLAKKPAQAKATPAKKANIKSTTKKPAVKKKAAPKAKAPAKKKVKVKGDGKKAA